MSDEDPYSPPVEPTTFPRPLSIGERAERWAVVGLMAAATYYLHRTSSALWGIGAAVLPIFCLGFRSPCLPSLVLAFGVTLAAWAYSGAGAAVGVAVVATLGLYLIARMYARAKTEKFLADLVNQRTNP